MSVEKMPETIYSKSVNQLNSAIYCTSLLISYKHRHRPKVTSAPIYINSLQRTEGHFILIFIKNKWFNSFFFFQWLRCCYSTAAIFRNILCCGSSSFGWFYSSASSDLLCYFLVIITIRPDGVWWNLLLASWFDWCYS